MGYNITTGSVQAVLPQLKQLLNEKETILFPSSSLREARRLAAKIRQGIKASANFEEYKQFASLDFAYRFRETEDGVLAEYVEAPMGIVVSNTPHKRFQSNVEGDNRGEERSERVEKTKRKTLTGPSTLIDVIAETVKNTDHETLIFPSAIFQKKDLVQLHLWIGEKGWMIVDQEDKGITLTKDPETPEEIVWKPR